MTSCSAKALCCELSRDVRERDQRRTVQAVAVQARKHCRRTGRLLVPGACRPDHPAGRLRPHAVRLPVQERMDSHATACDSSTPLDRASLHHPGRQCCDAAATQHDPSPALNRENELGRRGRHVRIQDSFDGCPRTVSLLLTGGSPLDPAILPAGNGALDVILRERLKRGGGRVR